MLKIRQFDGNVINIKEIQKSIMKCKAVFR